MATFLSENDCKAPFAPEMQKKTLDYLFRGERAPAWQTDLAHKVLQNGWEADKKGHIELFSTEVSTKVAKQTKLQLQERIIRQLYFEDLSDREYRINAAHQDTFHWIYAGPSDRHARKWCLFAPWLQSSSKIYWITGKPGSGKSTLMKFIGRDPRTRENLSHWSGSKPLVTAHFYFWNSGTQVQMSLEGFYRTVIHAVVAVRPGLIAEVLPNRWASAKLFGESMRSWTVRELQQAFEPLLKKSGTSYKLCLFIDGLDEYQGDHGVFVEQLSNIVATYDVRLCVASRPWPVFESAFSTGAHLTLQDLTFPDIVRFTWSKLHNHRGFKNLVAIETDYAGNLIRQIARKAEGVFLWVDLVTESLLQGLANADRVADLQRRLEELPGDLEELYRKMFDSIEPRYRQHACRYLQIARAAAGQLSALTLYFADEGDANNALEAKVAPLTEAQRLARCQTIKTRLSGCCKGFLEIPNPGAVYGQDSNLEIPVDPSGEDQPAASMDVDDKEHELADDGLDIDMTSSNGSATNNGIGDKGSKMSAEADMPHANDARNGGETVTVIPEPDRKVTYLHRTAKDFLESPDMQKRILTMSPPGFDRHVAILSGYLLLLKTLPVEGIDRVTLWRMVVDFLNIASESEASAEVPLTEYIDELDKTADIMFCAHGFSGEKCHWTATRRTSAGSKYEVGFLPLAAEFNLRRYIVSKLELGVPLFLLGDGRPILDYVIEDFAKYPSLCEPSTVASEGSDLPCLRVIKTLLDRGENPNARYKDSTTWERVLEAASKIAKTPRVEDEKKRLLLGHWAAIVETFIAHDADPVVNRNSPLGSKIREIFAPWMPQRAKELEKQLKRTRRRWSSIGKFITPRNWKLERLTFETTPLPVLRRLESATMAPPTFSESHPTKRFRLTTRTAGAPPQPSAPGYHVEDLAYGDEFSGANHPDQILREEARHRGPWEVASSRQLLTDNSRYWEDVVSNHRAYVSAYDSSTYPRYSVPSQQIPSEHESTYPWDPVPSEQIPYEHEYTYQWDTVPSEQIPSKEVLLLPPAILCSFNRIYRLSNGFWSSILIASIAARHGVRRRLVLVRLWPCFGP
jgi:hypothetical protein